MKNEPLVIDKVELVKNKVQPVNVSSLQKLDKLINIFGNNS